jgi:hypothetical protein
MRTGFRQVAVGFVVVVVCVLAVGCGGRTPQRGARVIGTATVGGKPASGSKIQFYDDANNVVAAVTADDNGGYVAVDVPRKPLKVTVEAGATGGPYGFNPPPPGTTPLPGTPLVPPAKIPKKYQKTDTSGLSLTVEGNEQKFDLSLE